MKNTLTTYEIAEKLIADENANWSRAGAFALAEYLEQYEEECEIELELDVVALRCDYSEFNSLQDWLTEYYGFDLQTSLGHAGIDLDDSDGDSEIGELIQSHIQDHGHLIEFSGGIIVSSF